MSNSECIAPAGRHQANVQSGSQQVRKTNFCQHPLKSRRHFAETSQRDRHMLPKPPGESTAGAPWKIRLCHFGISTVLSANAMSSGRTLPASHNVLHVSAAVFAKAACQPAPYPRSIVFRRRICLRTIMGIRSKTGDVPQVSAKRVTTSGIV